MYESSNKIKNHTTEYYTLSLCVGLAPFFSNSSTTSMCPLAQAPDRTVRVFSWLPRLTSAPETNQTRSLTHNKPPSSDLILRGYMNTFKVFFFQNKLSMFKLAQIQLRLFCAYDSSVYNLFCVVWIIARTSCLNKINWNKQTPNYFIANIQTISQWWVVPRKISFKK